MAKPAPPRDAVSVVIPVHNAADRVGKVVPAWADALARLGRGYELLVVDDGSTDGTGAILAARKDVQVIRHAVNRGYGQSLIDAFCCAQRKGYDWVITMDCDEQHEPEMIPVFMQHIAADQCDVISGSRYLENRLDNDLPPGDRRRRSLSHATELHNVLGNQVRILLHSPGDLVEQFAQGHEMRPLDIPVSLPALELQIDGVG